MTNLSPSAQIAVIEERFHGLTLALIDGSPELVQASSAVLQNLAVELVRLMNSAGGVRRAEWAGLMPRVKVLAHGLAVFRENLLRRAAYVDRALELVVPATREKSTYSGAGAYGAPIRQSGALKMMSA
jgi:hypothetical protein